MFKIRTKTNKKEYECKFIITSDNAILLIDYSLKNTKRFHLTDVEVFEDNKILSKDELLNHELVIFYETE